MHEELSTAAWAVHWNGHLLSVLSSSEMSGCVTWLPTSLGAQGDLCCLQVFHSKKIPFLGTCIGTFKMDVVTVYSQPGMTDCTAYLLPDSGFV